MNALAIYSHGGEDMEFWTVAVKVAGIGAIGAFVLKQFEGSSYHSWGPDPAYKYSPPSTLTRLL
jgi:hypothetical protein